MKYQIDAYQLHVNESKVLYNSEERSIRPKTLKLLVYLIENSQQILSKQQLLDAVWSNAGAQEYLLFQSIKEIRDIFSSMVVIKTHPSLGYQWVVEAVAILAPESKTTATQAIVQNNSPSEASKTKSRIINKVSALLFGLLLLTVGTSLYFSNHSQVTLAKESAKTNNEKNNKLPSKEVVVLPIENAIKDTGHDWVRLGAMDMLIKKLMAKRAFFVFPAEDVLMALSRSSTFDLQDLEQQSQAMRTQLGEVVTVHTKLLGSPMEYQLHYSFVGRYQIKQGVIFSESISKLLEELSAKVMAHYQQPNTTSRTPIAEQTADHNFLKAMELYHRHDYQSANHYLSAFLVTNPESAIAHRYLLKTYLALKEVEKADIYGEKALKVAKEQENPIEELRILFELGMLESMKNNSDKAQELISQSRVLANKHRDKLYIAFAHTQLGYLLLKQQKIVQAKLLFQEGLKYHQGFRCPYGQISNLNALANAYHQEGNHTEIENNLDLAISIAKDNGLRFEHTYLLLNKSEFLPTSPLKENWLNEAESMIITMKNLPLKNRLQRNLNELSSNK